MNPVMQVRRLTVDGRSAGRMCWLWCPGRIHQHAVWIVGDDGSLPDRPCWTWDGNLEQPTVQPSLLVYGSVYAHDDGTQCPDWRDDYETRSHVQGNCHSFIRAGQWEFLSDCAHHLAGQTVPMVPLPDWLVRP